MDINLGLTADATGTVDVITATYSPAPTLVDKKILFLVSSGANTVTTPTFAPNGLTAHTIVKRGGQALAIGDTGLATNVMILEYNLANTRWELLNPALTLVTQTITNGVTSTAPSEDTVFNALALKQDITTWTSFSGSAAPTGFSAIVENNFYYKKIGDQVTCKVYISGTSNAADLTFTLPFATANITANLMERHLHVMVVNNGTLSDVPGRIILSNNSTTATILRTGIGASWTTSGTKTAWATFTYYSA